MIRQVSIVGSGAVSNAGLDGDGLWSSLLAGRSGIGPLQHLDASEFPVQVAGVVNTPFHRFCPPCPWRDDLSSRPTMRNPRLLAGAVAQALVGCGWIDGEGRIGNRPGGIPPERSGVYTAVRHEESEERYEFALRIADDLDLRGPHLSLHDACATGTALLGEAFRDLRDGRADLAVVAAANADLTAETLCHYVLLGALSEGTGPDACRPFHRDRDGFVRAEGAACLVLAAGSPKESKDRVRITGYGTSADAYRITAGHPEERGLVLALLACLQDAGIGPEDVEHINAHGTGTRLNDLHEARALYKVFGDRAATIPVTAVKSVTGHASFASGLLEAIVSARTLLEGRIPPTAHLAILDPELPPLDVVRDTPRSLAVRNVLSISSAFGGLNAAVLLTGPAAP